MSRKLSLLVILAVTAYRIILLGFDTTDLFVDEAQYWLWAQHLDFGYYSKPPMIAWVIWLFTSLFGSDDIFWIRLAGPVLHMAAALVMIPAAQRLTGDKEAGYWAGATYVTLPGIALSSVLFSTDTVLLPFFALAVLAYSHLIEKKSLAWAIVMGIAIGGGMLSKYAMIYLPLTAALAAIFLPATRIALRDTLAVAASAIAVMAPNVWWNAANGGATLRHTSENAHWNGLNFHGGKALEFLGAQFGVVGPVIFAAMIFAMVSLLRGRGTTREKHLALLSWPIILLIVGQALMSRAYANWAATAYVAGIMLAIVFLLRIDRRILIVSLALNMLVTLALPLIFALGDKTPVIGNSSAINRYLGRAAISYEIFETAKKAGTDVIVSDQRDILADLFYTLRDDPITIRARSRDGFPRNYYEQEFPLLQESPEQRVLYVTPGELTCANGEKPQPVSTITSASGYMKSRAIRAFAVPAGCLAPAARGG